MQTAVAQAMHKTGGRVLSVLLVVMMAAAMSVCLPVKAFAAVPSLTVTRISESGSDVTYTVDLDINATVYMEVRLASALPPSVTDLTSLTGVPYLAGTSVPLVESGLIPNTEYVMYFVAVDASDDSGVVSFPFETHPRCINVDTNNTYSKLEYALDAYNSSETIELLENISESTPTIYTIYDTLTIQMGSYNLNIGSTVVKVDGSVANLTFTGTGDLTVASFDVEDGGYLDITAHATILNAGNVFADHTTGTRQTEVRIRGNLSSLMSGAYAVDAENGAKVTVGAPGQPVLISSAGIGVYAYGGSEVTVYGDISAADTGVDAKNGAIVTVYDGTIFADIGVSVQDGAVAFINNTDIVARVGIEADDASVFMEGNIDAVEIGIHATGAGAEVWITGDITVPLTVPAGFFEPIGITVGDSAEVYIIGTIIGMHYIGFDGDAEYSILPGDYDLLRPDGWLQYNGKNSPIPYVFVWFGISGNNPTNVPGTGDLAGVLLTIFALTAAVGGTVIFAQRRIRKIKNMP